MPSPDGSPPTRGAEPVGPVPAGSPGSPTSPGDADDPGTTGPVDAYRELFEHSADAILIIEGETFIDCNEATVKMLGYRDRAQLLEMHPSELSPPLQPDGRDSRAKASELIALAFERGSQRFEWEHVRADGEVFPVEVLLTAVQEPGRRVLHVVWRDIAERKRLEQELRQAQRNEAIGRLAGGIAHDFNNLLVVIVGNTDLLGMESLEGTPAHEYVKEIQLAADRATALVRQLLAFGRVQESESQVLDLNVLLEGIEGLLRRLIGEDIELEISYGTEPLHVRADGGQLEQVLFNLAANARDAMPRGGRLTVRTRQVCASEAGAEVSQVLLSVEDTGTGMSAAEIEHAFDPFFTTKEVGRGTGLGLATVYGIVKQAGGHASIRSRMGRGTVVDVILPYSSDELSDSESAEPRSAGAGGNETVLVVEDEPAVAALIQRVLERGGYEVLAASNGREGRDLYLRDQARIDLIVTDLIMPELSGAELVRELNAAGHSPRVLFLSGYTDDELVRLDLLEGEVDLLRKPFHNEELSRRVRRALARA